VCVAQKRCEAEAKARLFLIYFYICGN